MKEVSEMKEIWYQYVVNNKQHWCHGFTIRKLEQVKESVFANKDIMWDLLDRHSANKETPEEMKQSEKGRFNHCIGNFSTAILYTMIDKKLIKSKR